MNDLALDLLLILILLVCSSSLLKWKLFASPSPPSSILFAPRRCDGFWNSQWHLTAKHSRFLPTASFPHLCLLLLLLIFFPAADVQSRQTRAPALPVQQRADRMMPGCRYSAPFKSIFQTAPSHLPPCFIPWLSSSLLPSHRPVCPVELVSQAVRAAAFWPFCSFPFI